MDTWLFYQNEAGLWCWKHTCPEGVSTDNKRCFASRTDCIVDAMKHGYLTYPSRHRIFPSRARWPSPRTNSSYAR
jgi:hypothetical protein